MTGRNILDKPVTYIKELEKKQIMGQNSLLSFNNRSFCIMHLIFSGWQFRVFSSLLNQGVGMMKWREI